MSIRRTFFFLVIPTLYTLHSTLISTIIKIAISFTSLITCPIPPTDDRETTERRAKRYRALAAKNSALFLRLSPKKVDLIPKKVDSFPKKVDSHPKMVNLQFLHEHSGKKFAEKFAEKFIEKFTENT